MMHGAYNVKLQDEFLGWDGGISVRNNVFWNVTPFKAFSIYHCSSRQLVTSHQTARYYIFQYELGYKGCAGISFLFMCCFLFTL